MKMKTVTSLTIALLFSVPFTLWAQEAESQLMRVNQVVVKPDKMEAFRALHRDVFMPGEQAGGQPWRLAYWSELGNTYQFTLVTPVEDMSFLNESGGVPGGEAARDVFTNAVDSRHSFLIRSRPDMSLAPVDQGNFNIIYRFQLKDPSMAPQFVQLWNTRVLDAFRRSGVEGTQMFQVTQGGRIGDLRSVTPVDNFSGQGNGNPFGGLGPEAAGQLNRDMWQYLSEMELTVNRIDKELSYGLPGL